MELTYQELLDRIKELETQLAQQSSMNLMQEELIDLKNQYIENLEKKLARFQAIEQIQNECNELLRKLDEAKDEPNKIASIS